jgi:acetyl-CoA acetyltransferase
MTDRGEQRAVISGVAISDTGRRLGRDPWQLTAQAALAAVADAGLAMDDIDGISTYPGAAWPVPGFTGAGVWDARRILGIEPRWINGGSEIAGQIGSVINAAVAVGSGLVDHVLCFRTVWESSAQETMGRAAALMGAHDTGFNGDRAERVTGDREWSVPFGVGNPSFGALLAQRYFHDYGARRDQLAQVALVARRNAAANPHAVFRAPMTMDDYFAARMISDPLCLYDCDVPMDGSIALVVSNRSAAGGGPSTPVHIQAVGSAPGLAAAGAMLWSRTDLVPSDVDVAEVYDGWSILTPLWLEALQLCGPGDAAPFIEGGHRIALDGDLPINTGGGQLSAGRLHGYIQVHEACLQLRGAATDRQVTPVPEVAVVSTGSHLFAGCMLLTAGPL